MLMTVKNMALEMKLLTLFVLLMFVISSHSRELGNCEFNFTYNGQPVVYNFSRLSRQESWQTTNGRYRASIAVCHSLSAPSQCQNSSLCFSGPDRAVWNVVISNPETSVKGVLSQPSRPVLHLGSKQSCGGDRNYSVAFYFNCSSVEQDPVLVDVSGGCTLLVMWQTSAACPVDPNCTFDGINFSSLRHPDYYEVEGGGGTKFLLNVCGPVRSSPWNATDVAVYQICQNSSARIIGRLDAYRVQMLPQKGVVLTYTNSSKAVTAEIQFVCTASAANTNPKFITNSGVTYTFELETPLACKMWPEECMVFDRSGGRIDLSPLRKSSGNWVTKPSPTGVQYHINVCGPLNPLRSHNCSDGAAGACRTDSNSSVSLGYISAGLQITEADTVILEYTGGSECPSGGRYSIRIEFYCSKVIGDPVFMEETAGCVQHFLWETPESCLSMLGSGENCIVTEMQYGSVFNLTGLRSPERDYSLVTEGGDHYNINVCGPLVGQCDGREASVCLTKQGRSYAIGHVNSTVVYDNGALRFVLYGEGCKTGKNSSTVTIILQCWHSGEKGQPELLTQDGECNFYYVWNTGAACPPHQSTDCSVTHDGLFYDLNPLSDLITNHYVVNRGMKVKFILNVCHPVVFGKDASCQYTSAACMINMSNPNPSNKFTNIGDVGNGPYFEDGKLKLKYEGGAICPDPDGPLHMSTVITFECDHSTPYNPELLSANLCVYEFLWRTPAACPVNFTTEPPRQDDSCTVAVPGTDNWVNLRALRISPKMVSDSKGHNYTLVACGNLTSSPCGNSGVGVCQFEARDPSHFNSAGMGNSQLQYNHSTLSLEYTNGDPCNDGTRRSTRIVFVCEPNGPERVVFIDEPDSCSYLINWYTNLACSTQVECTTETWTDVPPISLAPLVRLDENYRVQVGNNTVVYINVCRPLLPVKGLSCPGGSSACMAHIQNDSLINEKSLGFAVAPVKGGSGKASIMNMHGSLCDSGLYYSSKLEFECDPKSGQGEPEFKIVTDDCQYQFLWKTSVTCEPFIKDVSVSDGQCILSNEQTNASIDLKTVGQLGMMQVQGFSVNLCAMDAVLNVSSGKSYGTLTSVTFDYQQRQVCLMFTGGSSCNSDDTYTSHLLFNCGRDKGSDEPRLLTKSACGVVMEWHNAAVCGLLVPSAVAHTVLHSEDTQSSSTVGLVVGLIVLVAVLCLLALYFRKPATCKHLRNRVTSLFSVRHNGQFYYSRLEAADEASQLLVSQMDGQESDSDDELLRM